MLRLRQAVIAARDLDAVVGRLREELGLGEPYSDPMIIHFGLRNAVFALGDTFLEVVSPVQEDTAAGRFLDRRGGDGGYMLMFQVDDVTAARERARGLGVREVFEVKTDEIDEVHLHPVDMRGAIVSISRPEPAGSWCWAGPGWAERAADLRLTGAGVGVADADAVTGRWSEILGARPEDAGVRLVDDPAGQGLTTVRVAALKPREPVEIGGVRFEFS